MCLVNICSYFGESKIELLVYKNCMFLALILYPNDFLKWFSSLERFSFVFRRTGSSGEQWRPYCQAEAVSGFLALGSSANEFICSFYVISAVAVH